LTCFSVPLVRLRLNAAPASKAHPAQTDHRALQARTALPAKAPALLDHQAATPTSTNACCQFHHSALAKLPPAQLVPPAHLAQTAAPATQAATDAMETTAHRVPLDLPAHQEPQATPARRVPLETQELSPLAPSHHRAHLVNPANLALPAVPEMLAPPARTATTELQASLVNLVSAVLPVATASPARPASQELQVPQAAATTAHQLVSLQDINLPALPTISTSIHLGWPLLLTAIYTTKGSLR
jgi:hypothetical protein